MDNDDDPNRNAMTHSISDLDKKSDDELIAIVNGKIPLGMLSARSTITAQDIIVEAKVILHKRQTKAKAWHEKAWGKIVIGLAIGVIILAISLLINAYKK
jgi:hypothetical protein